MLSAHHYLKHLLTGKACKALGTEVPKKQKPAGECVTNSHHLEGLTFLSYWNANKQTHTLDLCPIGVPQVPRSLVFIHVHIWDLCNVDQDVSALLKNKK